MGHIDWKQLMVIGVQWKSLETLRRFCWTIYYAKHLLFTVMGLQMLNLP